MVCGRVRFEPSLFTEYHYVNTPTARDSLWLVELLVVAQRSRVHVHHLTLIVVSLHLCQGPGRATHTVSMNLFVGSDEYKTYLLYPSMPTRFVT